MPKLIYRVVSACGALGYGYPEESLEAALRGQVDAIICDGGSMDAGPYYLGTGTEYFESEAVKLDFRHMVEAGNKIGCPVILGSCGMAGGDRNLDWMVAIAKQVFAELGIQGAKVAVIRSEIDPEIVIKEFRAGALRATGAGPDLDEEALRESTIVGQMGIHPLITALESGAQFILAGRSCDIALFASDMIRRNIDAGLAYHVGHVLECGALACDPGSPSDCLVAEIYDDGSAIFTAPNPARRCTAYSIAAHSLYEESHPQLQYYPEGILVMEKTQFFSRDGRSAGIRNSRFVHSAKPWPWSIKLEGSRRLGARKVSLIHIDPADLPKIPFGRAGLWPQRRAGAAGRCVAARTGHHRRVDRRNPRSRGSACKPADALPHSLRLSRPKGDRRQYCLSAVAQPHQLRARRWFVRRHRAERNARSRVLRELCRDQGRCAEAHRG